MNEFELLGFLLQDLRDNGETDEEDIGPAILRETTKIYELLIEHGHLSRNMFDVTGVDDPTRKHSVPKRYSHYQTTNYPINFVVFAAAFADWLLGKDKRERLQVIDLIAMIQELSPLQIEIALQARGSLVTVRSSKHHPQRFSEKVLVAK